MNVLSNAGVGRKILGINTMAILMTLSIMTASIVYYNHIEKTVLFKDRIYAVVQKALDARVAEKAYLQLYDTNFVGRLYGDCDVIDAQIASIATSVTDKDVAQRLEEMRSTITSYRQTFSEVVQTHEQSEKNRNDQAAAMAKAEKAVVEISNALTAKKAQLQMDGENLPPVEQDLWSAIRESRTYLFNVQTLYQQYLLLRDDKHRDAFDKFVSASDLNLMALPKLASQAGKVNNISMPELTATFRTSLETFVKSARMSYPLFAQEGSKARQLDELGNKLRSSADLVLDESTKDAANAKSSAVYVILALLIIGSILFLIISGAISRTITAPIRRLVTSLTEASGQTNSISAQISDSSQTIAQGTSAQASNLEETSASLEEMASMTRQNSDNAGQADNLMKQTKSTIDNGVEAMRRMSDSIDRIKASSAETAKIIKTIDEIAFQTNLLALNAAVEAARAGEAGKGFAVVAEEVRNLARRSAEAAKHTTDLIDGSQKNAEAGVAVSADMAKSLTEIQQSATQVGALIGEIAAASKEQTQGIDQINKAVAEMDKVVQSNAASAEESASVSTELAGRTEELEGMVSELTRIVEGGSAIHDDRKAVIKGREAETGTTSKKPGGRAAQKALPHPAKMPSASKTVRTDKTRAEVSPDQVIPLDDSELKGF